MRISDESVNTGLRSRRSRLHHQGVGPADPSQAWEEDSGVLLSDVELEPFSVAQYQIQADGLMTDLRGRGVLGTIDSTNSSNQAVTWQSQVPNAPARVSLR
jgi:hypothetical protein